MPDSARIPPAQSDDRSHPATGACEVPTYVTRCVRCGDEALSDFAPATPCGYCGGACKPLNEEG